MQRARPRVHPSRDPAGKWEGGGIPHTIEFLRWSIQSTDEADWPVKHGALVEIATFLSLIQSRAAAGDQNCGAFLGELVPLLWKKRLQLQDVNPAFRSTF